jgi:hypothetical protein
LKQQHRKYWRRRASFADHWLGRRFKQCGYERFERSFEHWHNRIGRRIPLDET